MGVCWATTRAAAKSVRQSTGVWIFFAIRMAEYYISKERERSRNKVWFLQYGKDGRLAEVGLEEHNLDRGNSPNEFENCITCDRHPAHPRGHGVRCARRVACHLHAAGFAQPATACPGRPFGCTSDGQFGSPAVGGCHGYVAGRGWL